VRFGRALGAIAVGVALTAGCGSSGNGHAASSTSATSSVATTVNAFPFEQTSANQFPGTSLEQRRQMAQQVCDSIKSHGDDYPAWLKLTLTRTDLVPFAASQQTLVAFSGLAVKTYCSQYVAQLQGALSSITASSTASTR